MGLPGSGKTTLASKLVKLINAKWINADKDREEANDWDFSIKGRIRQSKRMLKLTQDYKNDNNVVVDFVCPTHKTREIFNPDFIISSTLCFCPVNINCAFACYAFNYICAYLPEPHKTIIVRFSVIITIICFTK